MTTLTTTALAGFPGTVIVTQGAHVVPGGQVYGVFATEADARSIDADRLALGTVGRDALTDSQAAEAAANSDNI